MTNDLPHLLLCDLDGPLYHKSWPNKHQSVQTSLKQALLDEVGFVLARCVTVNVAKVTWMTLCVCVVDAPPPSPGGPGLITASPRTWPPSPPQPNKGPPTPVAALSIMLSEFGMIAGRLVISTTTSDNGGRENCRGKYLFYEQAVDVIIVHGTKQNWWNGKKGGYTVIWGTVAGDGGVGGGGLRAEVGGSWEMECGLGVRYVCLQETTVQAGRTVDNEERGEWAPGSGRMPTPTQPPPGSRAKSGNGRFIKTHIPGLGVCRAAGRGGCGDGTDTTGHRRSQNPHPQFINL